MKLVSSTLNIFLIVLAMSCSNVQNKAPSPQRGGNAFYPNQWVATDALSRELPQFDEVGPRRENKQVGVFYYVWHGPHSDKVYDITKILKQPKEQRSWGPKGKFHFWGEPEYGYYKSDDPWVIRHDLQMLSNADVDFLFLDVTNNFTYLNTVTLLCEISLEMRALGIPTPEICFLSNTKSGRVMNELYDEFYSNERFKELWFYWDGKPLVMGQPKDEVLRPEVRDFFTIKYSWAWTKSKEEPNHWQWIDKYPQDYGWKTDPSKPEQISVAVASHPDIPIGKSFHDGKQPPVDPNTFNTEFTDEGLHFAEQWERALEVDPQVVMVTQWNEWMAQLFEYNRPAKEYAGHPINQGDPSFVDAFTKEFNRDIAPMKGGYTDNYYYQLVANIRKYKGMDAPTNHYNNSPITIDGSFSDWQEVSPVFEDPAGDITHRNHPSYDPSITLTNTTGRNDIIESRVSVDVKQLSFYVKTSSDLSSHKDSNWMLLFIDSDQNKATGWEGYDFMINEEITNESMSTIKKWDGKKWLTLGDVSFNYNQTELELAIPRNYLNMDLEQPSFYFHWADNPQHLDDISAFFLDGDSAPDRRFDFSYQGKK